MRESPHTIEESVKASGQTKSKITIVYARDLPDSAFGPDSCCETSDEEQDEPVTLAAGNSLPYKTSQSDKTTTVLEPVMSAEESTSSTVDQLDSVDKSNAEYESYSHTSAQENDSKTSAGHDVSAVPPIEASNIEPVTLPGVSPRVKPSPRTSLIGSNNSPRIKPSPRINKGVSENGIGPSVSSVNNNLIPTHSSNNLELNEEIMNITGEVDPSAPVNNGLETKLSINGGPDNFVPSIGSAFTLTNFQPIVTDEGPLASGRSVVEPPPLRLVANDDNHQQGEPLTEYRAPAVHNQIAPQNYLPNSTNMKIGDHFSSAEEWEKNLSSLHRASPLKESDKSELSYTSGGYSEQSSHPTASQSSYYHRSTGSYPTRMSETEDKTSCAANIPSLHTESFVSESKKLLGDKHDPISVNESQSRNPTLDVVPADKTNSSSSRVSRSLASNRNSGPSLRSASVDRGSVSFNRKPLLRPDGKPPVSGSARDASGDGRSPSPHKFTHYNSPDDVLKKFNTKWQRDREQTDDFGGTLSASMKGSSLDNIPLLTSQVEDFNSHNKESGLSIQNENVKLKEKLRQTENALQGKVALLESNLDSYKERLEKTKQENVELRQRAETDQLKIQRLEDRLRNLETSMSALQAENRQLQDIVSGKSQLSKTSAENQFANTNGVPKSDARPSSPTRYNSDNYRYSYEYQNGDTLPTDSNTYQRQTRFYSIGGHVLDNKLPPNVRPTTLSSENNRLTSSHGEHSAKVTSPPEHHSSNAGWISPTALERRIEESSANKQYQSNPPKPVFSDTFEPPKIHPVLAKMAIKRKRQQNSGTTNNYHNDESTSKPQYEENRRSHGIKPPVSFNKFRAEAFTAASNNNIPANSGKTYESEHYGPPHPANNRDSGSKPSRGWEERGSEPDQSIGVYIMGRKVGTTSPEHRGESAHYRSSENVASPKKPHYPWRRGASGYRADEDFEDKWQDPPVSQYNSSSGTVPRSISNPNHKFIEETKKKLANEEWTAERDAELKRRVQKLLAREGNNHSVPTSTSNNDFKRSTTDSSSYHRRDHDWRPSANQDRNSGADRYSNGNESNYNKVGAQLVNSDDYEARNRNRASYPDDSRYYTSTYNKSDDFESKKPTYNTGSLPRNYSSHNRPSSASHGYSSQESSTYQKRPATSEGPVGTEGLDNKPYSRNSYSGVSGTIAASPSNPVPPLNLGSLQTHKASGEGITELTKSARRYADELVQKYMGQKESSGKPSEVVN